MVLYGTSCNIPMCMLLGIVQNGIYDIVLKNHFKYLTDFHYLVQKDTLNLPQARGSILV